MTGFNRLVFAMAELGHLIGFTAIGQNEGERLKRCSLTVPKGIAVVHADSASTDASIDFAILINAKGVELDMTMPFIDAPARNKGADEWLRTGPDIQFVQFIDGDGEIEAGWRSIASDFMLTNEAVAAVWGRRQGAIFYR